LQAFVPQIPFDDDELEQLGGDGGGGGGDDFAADALARRRARRRAALAARGELPRGACRRENLPLSWKKLDLAIKLVRRRPVDDALAQLAAVPRKSARLLRAAVANAAANAVDAGGDPSRLVVERVWATKGRYTKRLWIMGRGYSSARETRRSHLNVEVTEAPEGAEFLEVNGARRGRRGTGAREQRQQAPAPPALAAMGDAAARDAARQLDLARKRRFESARFVAPAAMARLARSRGSAVTTTTTTV
jgi:ribosomal protein L22